jgi:hypothetical protein
MPDDGGQSNQCPAPSSTTRACRLVKNPDTPRMSRAPVGRPGWESERRRERDSCDVGTLAPSGLLRMLRSAALCIRECRMFT